MNELSLLVCWCVLQVTALTLLCSTIYFAVGRFAPRARGSVALLSLLSVVLVSVLALSPWPRWATPEWPRLARIQVAETSNTTIDEPVQVAEYPPAVAAPIADSAALPQLVPDIAPVETATTPEEIQSRSPPLANMPYADASPASEGVEHESFASPATSDPPVPFEVSTPAPADRRQVVGLDMGEVDRAVQDGGIEQAATSTAVAPAETSSKTPVRISWDFSGWPLAVLIVTCLSALVGMIRLLIGLNFVRKQRRTAATLEDPELLDLVDILCAEAGGTRWVDVRVSPILTTAATIGWRRPMILLPIDWSEWSHHERRAVLAHEIAHIRRRDFLSWIAAQVGVALHFYHPLVHWLAHRLRFEQELAADALGATLSGGKASYVNALASLRCGSRTVRCTGRPAPFFLPAALFYGG